MLCRDGVMQEPPWVTSRPYDPAAAGNTVKTCIASQLGSDPLLLTHLAQPSFPASLRPVPVQKTKHIRRRAEAADRAELIVEELSEYSSDELKAQLKTLATEW